MSYNGRIQFGLIGDFDAMSDLDSLALDLEAAIEELSAAAPKPKKARKAKPAAAKKAKKTEKADAAENGGSSAAKAEAEAKS
jgi:hypothetical protein